MTTAEIAILTTGAVGLGAPALSAAFQWARDRQTADRERLSKDLDELRALLDELTAAAYEHTLMLLKLERWMQTSSLGLPLVNKVAPDLEASRRTLYTLNDRFALGQARAI